MSTSTATTTQSEWFYLQTTDNALLLVSRALITGGPEYWRARFTGTHFALKPLREVDALPVYGIDITVAMLKPMLEMIQVPESVNEYWRHLPLPLREKTTLLTWRGFMRAYGFVDTVDLDAEAVEEPQKKRRKALSAFEETLVKLAQFLYDLVFTEHPKAAGFLAGTERGLVCDFMSRYVACAYAAKPYQTKCSFLGTLDNVFEVGHYLYRYLTAKQRVFLLEELTLLLPKGATARLTCILEHNEKAKANTKDVTTFNAWPLSLTETGVPVNARYHEVVELRFEY